MFDIFYIGENTKLKDALPFAKQVESYDEIMSRTKMYWVIEPNIEIVDSELFDFRTTAVLSCYLRINPKAQRKLIELCVAKVLIH